MPIKRAGWGKGLLELGADIGKLTFLAGKGTLSVAGNALTDFGKDVASIGDRNSLPRTLFRTAYKTPYYGLKGLGYGYHYGVRPLIASGLHYSKNAKSNPIVGNAVGLAAAYGINKMGEGVQSPQADAIRNGYDPDIFSYKAASVIDDRPNIPVDNINPNTNSPEDYYDYYDYQEWVTTKGNNYPEREETEQNKFDNPQKIASALGLLKKTVVDLPKLPQKVNKKLDIETLGNYSDRIGKEHSIAVMPVGAAVTAAAIGIPVARLNIPKTGEEIYNECLPDFMSY